MRVTTSKKSQHRLTIALIGLSLLACSERSGDLFAIPARDPSVSGSGTGGSSGAVAGSSNAGGAAGTSSAGATAAGSAGVAQAGAGAVTAGGGTAGGSGGASMGIGGSAGSSIGVGGIAGTSASGGAGRGGSSGASGTGAGGIAGQAGTSGTGGVSLDPTPGTYQRACDGSLGVRFDAHTFLSGSDEDQELRLYRRGLDAPPERRFDLSSELDLSDSAEADFEDAARIGDRVYVVSSHGRTSEGELDRSRFRFFAFDLDASGEELALEVAGRTETLLDDLLAAENWDQANTAVIAAIRAAAGLDQDENEDLTPDANGATLEGLAQAGTALAPATLWLGFRNPTFQQRAIVVSLLNPDAAITGVTAHFGEAVLLDLGGLGIRALTWSSFHGAVIVLAGPRAPGGPFRLFEWSGLPTDAAVPVVDFTGLPSDSSPEAIIAYPDSPDVQILFDQGEHRIDDEPCKDASEQDRSFGDRIVHVP